jgi:hypothetical protein
MCHVIDSGYANQPRNWKFPISDPIRPMSRDKTQFPELTRNRKSAHPISRAADYQFWKKKYHASAMELGTFPVARNIIPTWGPNAFCLFLPWRGVSNGDYARNQTSQLCHAISTPDKEGVDYHTMVRMAIMALERGFVPNRKKNYWSQRKGLHFLCSTYITQRVANMAHLGKFDSGSVYIQHWQTTALFPKQ